MIASLTAGALAAAVAGLVVGIPSLRLKGDYLAIVTLGFGEIIRVLILNIPAVGGATGFTDAIPITNFFWIFAMAILTIAVVRNIATSTFGHALTAIRGDEIAAEAMGINTTRYKVLAFVVSAALAGVAGGLSGQLFANPLNPQNLNFVKSIEVIVMIVLGGIGSITGAVFGATTLTILPGGAADVRPAVSRTADGPVRAAAHPADDLPAAGPVRPPRDLGWGWLQLAATGRRPAVTAMSGAPASPWLLEARNVTKRFGGLTAVKALTINVARGALYGLIGPNGAGKTTVFNLLTGRTTRPKAKSFSTACASTARSRIKSRSSASRGRFRTFGSSPT